MKSLFVTIAAILVAASPVQADAPLASAPQQDAPAKPFVYVPKLSDVAIGKQDAPVVVVEYASLSCPHCAHFFTDTLPQLTEKYIDTGKVRFVYRDYPLNNQALKAAILVQCAAPDRRHDFITVLFKMQSRWALGGDYKEALTNIAVLGGVERGKYEKCNNNEALQNAVVAVAKEASDDYKVTSTPSFFINGQKHQGENGINGMSQAIDNALAQAEKK